MYDYTGIAVSLERSSVCILDTLGQILREAKVASEPEAFATLLAGLGMLRTRVGLEAGPLLQWLYAGLQKAGFEVALLETHHVKVTLLAMIGATPAASPGGSA